MKIVINYDLIKRAQLSKEDIRWRVMRQQLARHAIATGLSLPLIFSYAFPSRMTNINDFCILFSLIFLGNLYGFIMLNVVKTPVSISWMKESLSLRQIAELSSLKSLVSQLNDYGIHTSLSFLQGASVYSKRYRLEKESIVQEKYIKLGTTNFAGEIEDISLLQEHVIGEKQYVLSLGSPRKALQPKLTPSM